MSTRGRPAKPQVAGKAAGPRGVRAGAVPIAALPGPVMPLLPAADVLRSILALSREVSGVGADTDLLTCLYRVLRELLPGRLVAVRRLEAHEKRASEILTEDELIDGAQDMPATIVRGALKHANVRDNLPSDFSPETGQTHGIRVTDVHPMIFRDSAFGFTVPLVAGGRMLGGVHVGYRTLPMAPGVGRVRRPGRNLPVPAKVDAKLAVTMRADKALVIPIANHIAAVAHTRTLLRETAYLQDYLAQLVDQANVLIVAADLGGTITIWNRAMNRLTGFSRAQAMGRDITAWLTQLGAGDLGFVMRQVAAGGEAATRELRLPSQGGAMLRAAFNVVTVRGHKDQPAAVLAIGQDVTMLRALQNQIIHAEKLATVGQIAAGVAHEINNPLTSIQVCVEAVLRKASHVGDGQVTGTFDASDLDRLTKIREGSERIRKFARDLVSYARPSGSDVEPVSVNEVTERALSFCEHVLHEANAKLERDFFADLPPITAIRDQLMQVVINLVTNAAQALPPAGGTVRVRTWRSGEATVSFAVSDTGGGIKEEDRAQVFEPFFSTKPAGRGTGLGLSIVRNIVFSHGGQITFQSRQGGGTTFVVTLPTTYLGPAGPQGAESRK